MGQRGQRPLTDTRKTCRVGQERIIQSSVPATMRLLFFEIYKRGFFSVQGAWPSPNTFRIL
jgi:hypothetical protein